jgi:predicted CxxxxCH...CXXCH cytochrome family protein
VPWCAGDCDDNDPAVFPGNNEGPYYDPSCSDGVDNDCNSQIDGSDGKCAPPTCETRITPKNGPHMFDLLDVNDDSLISNPCGWCHWDTTGLIDQRLQCQRCHADPADTSDPLNGILRVLYPLDPPYGFGTAPVVKLHSSTTVGDKYGNWDMHCLNCHNPHLEEQNLRYGTSYGKLVKELVCYDNLVTGDHVESLVFFTASGGTGSFADGPPHDDNICEICHTRTDHHRNDGRAPADLDPNGVYTGHFDGQRCTECHPHSRGFKPTCGSCHDAPPPTGTHLKHFGGTKFDAEYGSTKITQDITRGSSVYIMNCGNCHPMDAKHHMNGVPNSGGGTAEIELYNPSAPPGSLKALNLPTASYTPGPVVLTDNNGMQYTQGTCNGVYCHSGPAVQTTQPVPVPAPDPDSYYPLVYNPPWQSLVSRSRIYGSPTWGVDSLGCDGCHGYPITTECVPFLDPVTGSFVSCTEVSAGAGDSHAWIDENDQLNLHMWNMGYDPLQCSTCHYKTVRDQASWARTQSSIWLSDISIFDKSVHINGSKDIAFTPIPVDYQTVVGTVSHDLSTASYDPLSSTCSNVSCHKNQTEVIWGNPFRTGIFDECNVCHRF